MPARNRRQPRELSWPLTPSDIRAALGETGADRVDFDDRPWGDGTLLHVEWIPPLSSNHGMGIHPLWWRTVRIAVGPLPAAQRADARALLRQHVLPELAAWIDAARSAPEPWTLVRQSRSWRIADGLIGHRDGLRPYA